MYRKMKKTENKAENAQNADVGSAFINACLLMHVVQVFSDVGSAFSAFVLGFLHFSVRKFGVFALPYMFIFMHTVKVELYNYNVLPRLHVNIF